MDKPTITQKSTPTGQYPYVVEVNIPAQKLYLTRPAMTQEHAAIIATQFLKQYPGATLVWK